MQTEIKLSQGKKAIIDERDKVAVLSHPWKWYCRKTRLGTYYAVANIRKETGKKGLIFLHRFLIPVPKGKFVDHINGNGLDNRRSNLRIASTQQNTRNARKKKGTVSKYKGVSFHKQNKNWKSFITKDYKFIHLGSFKTEIEAAKAYDVAAKKLFGEFCLTNEKLGLL